MPYKSIEIKVEEWVTEGQCVREDKNTGLAGHVWPAHIPGAAESGSMLPHGPIPDHTPQ